MPLLDSAQQIATICAVRHWVYIRKRCLYQCRVCWVSFDSPYNQVESARQLRISCRITVPNQAYIDASDASNPILSYGVSGIVGLGFTKLSSIDHALQGVGKTDGKSLLYNLFADNPKEPNFIAFGLQRTTDGGGDVEGSFTIGVLLLFLRPWSTLM